MLSHIEKQGKRPFGKGRKRPVITAEGPKVPIMAVGASHQQANKVDS